MTQLDVVYRYGAQPSEAATLAIARVREVYGVRKVTFDETETTIRVEYDATRLTDANIHQLLRRAGLDIVEELQQFTLPPPPPPPAPPATT
jgi:copper chaperone CopZ